MTIKRDNTPAVPTLLVGQNKTNEELITDVFDAVIDDEVYEALGTTSAREDIIRRLLRANADGCDKNVELLCDELLNTERTNLRAEIQSALAGDAAKYAALHQPAVNLAIRIAPPARVRRTHHLRCAEVEVGLCPVCALPVNHIGDAERCHTCGAKLSWDHWVKTDDKEDKT